MLRYGIIFFALFFIAGFLFGESVSIEAGVEKTTVYVGESFVYQIQVKGSNNPAEPELKGFDDFDVVSLGRRDSSNISISIINGRQTRVENLSFIYSYQLTPKKPGTLTIPPVMVNAGGNTLVTESFRIQAREPGEVEDYKLRLSLSKNSCYVGEPLVLTCTWYIGSSVNDIAFNFPLFSDNRFSFEDYPQVKSPSSKYYSFAVSGQDVEFEYPEKKTTFEGKSYNTLVFRKVIIPKRNGGYSFPKATASFSGLTGYKKVRDFWGVQDQPVYEQFVIPSNALYLTVRDVPEEGKPANYSGLIGESYSVSVSAGPTEVKVGDPITLTITLKGPRYLTEAKIPPLGSIKVLADSFKIPEDRASGKVSGDAKVFTQTLRANSIAVKEIPAFEIPYFNTKSGRYEAAVSKAIPLSVAASELKTFMDLEGMAPVDMKTELEAWTEGIAHNYEGFDVLQDRSAGLRQSFSNPLVLLLLILPFLAFVASLYVTRFSHLVRVSDADKRSRKAFTHLSATLKSLNNAGGNKYRTLLEELNRYLGAKLNLKGEALTFKDVEGNLRSHGIPSDVLSALKEIYSQCEAGNYAGGAADADAGALGDKIVQVLKEIERSFK